MTQQSYDQLDARPALVERKAARSAEVASSATASALEDGRRRGLHLGARVVASSTTGATIDVTMGDLAPGRPFRADALVPWFCAAKPLLAVAVARLCHEGALAWDRPIGDLVPALGKDGDLRKRRITLRHVLTHSAGFPLEQLVERDDAGLAEYVPALPWDDAVDAVCRVPLAWEPGSVTAYQHHTSWYLVGEVIRRATGTDHGIYVRDQVLRPLGIGDVHIGEDAARLVGNPSVLAPLFTDGSAARSYDLEDERVLGQGGPYATRGSVSALHAFYRALLDPDVADALGVPTAGLTEVTRDATGLVFDEVRRGLVRFGLGFEMESSVTDPAFPVFGRRVGAGSFGHRGERVVAAFADPAAGVALAMFFNGSSGNLVAAQRRLAVQRAVYDDLGIVRPGTVA